MDFFTVSAALTSSDTALATLPADSSKPYLYWLKAANAGTAAQVLRIKQDRHTRAVRDNTIIPANGQTQSSGFPQVGETVAWGGNPDTDKLLTFNAGGTIVAAANPDGSIAGGSIHATFGFAIP